MSIKKQPGLHRKKIAAIVGTIGIITVAGFLLEIRSNQQKDNQPTSTNREQVDQTAAWNTYVNHTYKFYLKYPRPLQIVSNGDTHVDFVEQAVKQGTMTPSNIKISIDINQFRHNFDELYTSPDNPVIADEQHALDAKFTKVRNRMIQGYRAIDYTYNVPGNQTEISSSIGTIINKNGTFIEISTNSLDTTVFNQILSTLKLTT
jgi:hypothetical protein